MFPPKAAGEKLDHYGEAVWAVCFSSLGRLGPDGARAIEAAAAEARDWGRHLSARDLRVDLERAVLRATAQTVLKALGGGFDAATGPVCGFLP